MWTEQWAIGSTPNDYVSLYGLKRLSCMLDFEIKYIVETLKAATNNNNYYSLLMKMKISL